MINQDKEWVAQHTYGTNENADKQLIYFNFNQVTLTRVGYAIPHKRYTVYIIQSHWQKHTVTTGLSIKWMRLQSSCTYKISSMLKAFIK